MTKNKPNSPDFSELRRQAEERFAAKPREIDQPLGYVEKLLHELQVHRIELEVQNEELRSTQVQLQESLMEYSDLYDFAPVGYFTLNGKGLILKANLAGATLLGVERSNLIDKPLRPLIAGESRAVFDHFRKTLFKTLTKQLCEVKLLRKGNLLAHLLIEGIVLENSQGSEKQCRVAIMDITERKQAEEKINSAKAMLQTVFDGISDPLLMVEKDLTVRMLNEAASRYFRIADGKETAGKFCYELAFGKREPCDGCVARSALQEGKSIDCERKGLLDSERTEQVVVYPVDEPNAGFSGAIIRISDITESKNMEQQLSRADRLSSLGQLSGGIAHEIRNPLAGIVLFVDVLNDEEKFSRTSQEQSIFEEIKLNIKKIDGIIRGVLAFSRHLDTSSEGKLEVSGLIDDTIKLWRSRMVNDRIQLRLSLEDNLPEILGDSIEIQQVLTNLVQNALEAMEKDGTLSISVENGTLSFDTKRPAVIIKVQDSGPGISFDQQKNIFNPFFTTKHTGTGLGLAISHRIVSRHGGLISFESVPDVGTTFVVELPAAPKC